MEVPLLLNAAKGGAVLTFVDHGMYWKDVWNNLIARPSLPTHDLSGIQEIAPEAMDQLRDIEIVYGFGPRNQWVGPREASTTPAILLTLHCADGKSDQHRAREYTAQDYSRFIGFASDSGGSTVSHTCGKD